MALPQTLLQRIHLVAIGRVALRAIGEIVETGWAGRAVEVMRRHADQFEWLTQRPQSWQKRPGGWPETRYERKARTVYGHEVWYFRYRRR